MNKPTMTFKDFLIESRSPFDVDDEAARESHGTIRGKVQKTKTGGWHATNKSGTSKMFPDEKSATKFSLTEAEGGLKPADLFIGRFQPFHMGHAEIIKKMNNPVVVIVKGKASSEDKNKNPLSVEQQTALIKKVFPDVHVFTTEVSGFIPAIIGMVKEKGFEVKKVFAGEDRFASYKRQVEQANAKIAAGTSEHEKLDISFEQTPRLASATDVRVAIRANDFAKYKSLMPGPLANEKTFNQLKKLMGPITESAAEFKKHIVYIEKGLTRDEAMKKAPWKKSYGDCRGFKYDKNTGKGEWI